MSILYFLAPTLVLVLIGFGFNYVMHKDEREEKNMLKSMNEDEKKEYLKTKNNMLLEQQKSIAAKGATSSGLDLRSIR